jgi:hypothetical protein
MHHIPGLAELATPVSDRERDRRQLLLKLAIKRVRTTGTAPSSRSIACFDSLCVIP